MNACSDINIGNYIGGRDGWQLYLDGCTVCAKKGDILIKATPSENSIEVLQIPPEALLEEMHRSDLGRAVAKRLSENKRPVTREELT